ncbi:hypothetical protein Aconfl_26500 [Algoriphagus confluentis]|uniref:Baseplate protein J-like domain-containing protein n=2 Tax=Algoriphagus confluentis TaxID=1697556 RepID=A0ABQ6PTE8_9BACT|nr:hypothetical protein Aconfl_26500 [Algoriphagus confluentis]
MQEPVTISKSNFPSPASDYRLLRKEALAYIQRLSGNIWTDYNAHDPGVTILEVLCYAITDLSFRTQFPIQDLLADPSGSLAGQFFQPSQILPSKALTLTDYRKLLMDVEVMDEAPDSICPKAGVKNAWITLRESNELPVFPDRKAKKLAYQPFPAKEQALKMGILYDVLLEFDTVPVLGDLNENQLSMEIELTEHPELKGTILDIQIEFPRWDQTLDWTNSLAIKKAIQSIDIQFQNLPSGIDLKAKIQPSKNIKLEGSIMTNTGPQPLDGLPTLSNQINQLIYQDEEGALVQYRLKTDKIREILAEVKRTLHANRNLCEDFVDFQALKVEEILVCADIELSPEADVEKTEAAIFSAIGDFLSPQVNFYSLEEMIDRGKEGSLPILKIQQNPAKLWINLSQENFPKPGAKLSILGSGNNAGTYEVLTARLSPDGTCELRLSPNFSSSLLREDDQVYLGDWDNAAGTPTEKIFEGPLLKHGFIDEKELTLAERKSQIHVSDLIHLIMDIPGVEAVKNIQIANLPQDDPKGTIPSKSVRWCLKLALEKNYIPRLNVPLSKLTFFKENLPFIANREEVEDLLEDIQSGKRPQKKSGLVKNFLPLSGEHRDLENYFSIQNDFPLVYGLGEDGMLPQGEGRPQPHQVKQLKAYLMVFEQYLANYLSQLAHLKHLFSHKNEKDQFGNRLVDRTYFFQNLSEVIVQSDGRLGNKVPDSAGLWKNLGDLKELLGEITESRETFLIRRNKFLNHLLGRFAESLTDYALLSERIHALQAQDKLIDDKLHLLQNYPAIGAGRGLGFDYSILDHFYHQRNLSGLEDRIGALYGIRKKSSDWLIFSAHFVFEENTGVWSVRVVDDSDQPIFELLDSFLTQIEAAEALEKALLLGSLKENYLLSGDPGSIQVLLVHLGVPIGASIRQDLMSSAEGGDADILLGQIHEILLGEFMENPRANRKNLSLGLKNWVNYSISTSLGPGIPGYEVEFHFFDAPFGKGEEILLGKILREVPGETDPAQLETLAEEDFENHLWQLVAAASKPSGYQVPEDTKNPYRIQLIDPLRGGLLAESSAADFNQSLAKALEDGDWGEAWLLAKGSPPESFHLNQAVSLGSKIVLQGTPQAKKGDKILFEQDLLLSSVSLETHELMVEGDLSQVIQFFPEVQLVYTDGGKTYLKEVSILSVRFDGTSTRIVTASAPKISWEGGSISLSRQFEVVDMDGAKALVRGEEEMRAIDKLKTFFLNQFFSHEGTHLFEHILLRPKHKGKYSFSEEGSPVTETLEDRLLDPHFQEECQCTLDDPYTCMTHVILPFWAGRFTNRDLRKFLENKFKLEAPAHVFLTICWIHPKHMEQLERAWKIWLLENLKQASHPKQLAQALGNLIEILEKVRNVYPSGTLHDCEVDDNLDQSIILNFSSLGEF